MYIRIYILVNKYKEYDHQGTITLTKRRTTSQKVDCQQHERRVTPGGHID